MQERLLAPIRLMALSCLIAGTATAGHAAAPPMEPPAAPQALRELVTGLDRTMFDAFNAHDVDALMAMFSDDLEFYHDTGGLQRFEQVRDGFRSVFASNPDIRRELVPGSLEVYPVSGHGAIEIGAHTFCHTENGRDDCGTFRFVHVWRYRDQRWQVSRVVSYGH